jgi:hypothetical protein
MAPARRPYAFDDRRHCFVIEYGGHCIGTTRLITSGLALKTIAEGTDQKVITQAYCRRTSGWTIRPGSISFTISIPAR